MATILTFNKISDLDDVYFSSPSDLSEAITQSVVNLLALMGVVFIVIKTSQKKNNINYGLALAAIMFIMTYLSPSVYLARMLKHSEKYTKSNNISTLIGILIVITIILVEEQIIHYFSKPLSIFFEKLLSMNWVP